METFLTWLLVILVRVFLGGFVVMLMAGSLHHGVWEPFPAWSYGQSITVSVALSVVGGYFYQPNSKS